MACLRKQRRRHGTQLMRVVIAVEDVIIRAVDQWLAARMFVYMGQGGPVHGQGEGFGEILSDWIMVKERPMRFFRVLCLGLLVVGICAGAGCTAFAAGAFSKDKVTLRPPAVPLVACDPYFSIWSCADKMTDVATKHWTGPRHALTSMVRIDGKAYRLMGDQPEDTPALEQVGLVVLPTRTIYDFEGAGVHVTLTFMTPALPDDLDLLSRPVTYLTWDVKAVDGGKHTVQLYFDAAAEIAVNDVSQEVECETYGTGVVTYPEESKGGVTEMTPIWLSVAKIGTREQPVLVKKGDAIRIDWGYLYMGSLILGEDADLNVCSVRARKQFVSDGTIPAEESDDEGLGIKIKLGETGSKIVSKLLSVLGSDSFSIGLGSGGQSRKANAGDIVAVLRFNLGEVGEDSVRRWLLVGYDDEYSINYFGKKLRPYWRRDGMDGPALMRDSAYRYEEMRKRCEAFDEELMADLRKAGGEKYALMCALAYRQCQAGNKLAADSNGQPLLFPKENTSNGCIGTVDVIYPMAPQYLLFGPSLTKAMLVSNLDYANSERWKFPFAPHDLGTYPKATAQAYGGGERSEENQMPVEETGNMLILLAALAQMEGNADFAGMYWPLLEKWAEYLKDKGFDPENQLCTDDFMGHLAHNVNLSSKATLGLASFAYLCKMRGELEAAKEYGELAKEFAVRWAKEADDGDHFRLAFDKPGTWSQKYNLVWDRILGFGLYPEAVFRKEMDYYLKIMNPYGVSLDNRRGGTLAKLDWSLWTATLTGKKSDFEKVMIPVFNYVNDTPQRVAMGDMYNTANSHHIGMHTRPVVGGVFLKMLYNKGVWKKWASRDKTKASDWAALPKRPKIVVVVPSSEDKPVVWRYVARNPGGNWFDAGFDDSAWKKGPGGFGTDGTPGAVVRTEWRSGDIWLRRQFTMPEGKWNNLHFRIHHDEDAEVYINGTAVAVLSSYTVGYDYVVMSEKAKAALKPGANTIAVHCHQTSGGQYIDIGIVDVIEQEPVKAGDAR